MRAKIVGAGRPMAGTTATPEPRGHEAPHGGHVIGVEGDLGLEPAAAQSATVWARIPEGARRMTKGSPATSASETASRAARGWAVGTARTRGSTSTRRHSMSGPVTRWAVSSTSAARVASSGETRRSPPPRALGARSGPLGGRGGRHG